MKKKEKLSCYKCKRAPLDYIDASRFKKIALDIYDCEKCYVKLMSEQLRILDKLNIAFYAEMGLNADWKEYINKLNEFINSPLLYSPLFYAMRDEKN